MSAATVRYEHHDGCPTWYVDCRACEPEQGRRYLTFFQGEGASVDARRYALRHDLVVHPAPRCPAHDVALVPSAGLVSPGWECPICLEPSCDVCEEKMPRCTCGGRGDTPEEASI